VISFARDDVDVVNVSAPLGVRPTMGEKISTAKWLSGADRESIKANCLYCGSANSIQVKDYQSTEMLRGIANSTPMRRKLINKFCLVHPEVFREHCARAFHNRLLRTRVHAIVVLGEDGRAPKSRGAN